MAQKEFLYVGCFWMEVCTRENFAHNFTFEIFNQNVTFLNSNKTIFMCEKFQWKFNVENSANKFCIWKVQRKIQLRILDVKILYTNFIFENSEQKFYRTNFIYKNFKHIITIKNFQPKPRIPKKTHFKLTLIPKLH